MGVVALPYLGQGMSNDHIMNYRSYLMNCCSYLRRDDTFGAKIQENALSFNRYYR